MHFLWERFRLPETVATAPCLGTFFFNWEIFKMLFSHCQTSQMMILTYSSYLIVQLNLFAFRE